VELKGIDLSTGKISIAAAPQSAPKSAKPPEREAPLDLSGMRELRAEGTLRITALTYQQIKASDVRTHFKAGEGKLALDRIEAKLYGGSASGSAWASTTRAPRLGLRQTLSGVQIGPLLRDALGKEPIEGRGNVDVNVATEGGNLAQWKSRLGGSARLDLRDGAIRGVNIGQAVRRAKAGIGALRGGDMSQSGTASANEKTDFSELNASFRIADGVARNDDLQLKSPLIRVAGAGTVNVGRDRLDYLVKATVVSSLQGQGGPELQALRGLTVPVRLAGPFSAIGWQIDFQGLAGELVKQQLDERKGELRGRLFKELGVTNGDSKDSAKPDPKARSKADSKADSSDRLQQQLKGLFGK
jgi:AsmA protein